MRFIFIQITFILIYIDIINFIIFSFNNKFFCFFYIIIFVFFIIFIIIYFISYIITINKYFI